MTEAQDAQPVHDEAMAEAIIADCDGDPRAAVLALLRINHALMRERRTIVSKVSKVYIRLRAPGFGEVE